MRVLVTGCFDIIHPGHIYLFKKAAEIGEVYVILARDSTIKKWKKQVPAIPELQRLEVVQSIKYVKFATLGNENNNFMRKALDLNPDLILLGPNQKISEEKLRQKLEINQASHIQIKRCETLFTQFPLKSSSEIKQRIIQQYLTIKKSS
ncbi:MAG: adenylyltransferase/cytidyltransferase family protein [Promethearchaeota archaeon]